MLISDVSNVGNGGQFDNSNLNLPTTWDIEGISITRPEKLLLTPSSLRQLCRIERDFYR